MRDIGKNIRAARIRKCLTQAALAERLHVSRQTISNYETGRSRPDIAMLLSIAEALNTDVQTLLYGAPVPPEKRRVGFRHAAPAVSLFLRPAGLDTFPGLRCSHEPFSYQSSYQFLPIWDALVRKLTHLLYKRSAVFTVLGAVLWLTEPPAAKQTANTEKSPE